MSNKISKRIRFKDRPDWINGRYFIFTLPYSIFYIVGAILGYSKTKNLFCLCFSGFCGILFLLLSIGHIIDYYRGVSIESFYVAIPLCMYYQVSMYVSIYKYFLNLLFLFAVLFSCVTFRLDFYDMRLVSWFYI